LFFNADVCASVNRVTVDDDDDEENDDDNGVCMCYMHV
jgi:hypothetical protein